MTVEERFWAKVDRRDDDECWLWTAGKNAYGYGKLRCQNGDGWHHLAHRLSWELANGKVPDGMLVLHACDVRHCVNPKHLFLGTVADNNADRIAKGRSVHPHGENSRFARLTWDEVDEIRRLLALGEKQKAVAAKFGVHDATVGRIARGLTWRQRVHAQWRRPGKSARAANHA